MNSIIKNIPNSITCLNLLSGCFACYAAFNGDFGTAAIFIGLSAVFDFMDGMTAVCLKLTPHWEKNWILWPTLSASEWHRGFLL